MVTKFILFHASWCGHCVRFRSSDVWKDLQKELEEDKTKVIEVESAEVEKSDKVTDEQKKLVQGWPTIVVEKDGKNYVFSGERTLNKLMDFVKNPEKDQQGGGNKYYQKYLKYKRKYLKLRSSKVDK